MYRKRKKTWLKPLLIGSMTVVAVPAIYVGSLLALSMGTDYQPPLTEPGQVKQVAQKPKPLGKSFSITTYNIGYCGLDASQDFFMDGGKRSRAGSQEQVMKNLDAVKRTLRHHPSDLMFLQEVDESGSRSYQVNQVKDLSAAFSAYHSVFTYNYKVVWVPVPWLDPMGSAYSGLLTLSKTNPESSTRYKLPGDEPIPKRYFDLKRCVLENRYPLVSGKELIVLNVHLSAFDEGGLIRAQQMKWLKAYVEKTYDPKKNYVLLGGDWNHLLDKGYLEKIKGPVPSWIAVLPEDLKGLGFNIVYDPKVNTVRTNEAPYVKGVTLETVIDGFIASPNLKVKSVKADDLSFENTDHQPVTAVFEFK